MEDKHREDIFIFDLDGVLVMPGGYRRAVRDTAAHFSRMLGLGEAHPDEETISLFEAMGITNEWDMIPIWLSVALCESLKSDLVWERGLGTLVQSASKSPVDFRKPIKAFTENSDHRQLPADSFWNAIQDRRICPELDQVDRVQGWLQNTRSVKKNPITRYFQNLVLGSKVFTALTELEAAVNSESYLRIYDTPLLYPEIANLINSRVVQGQMRTCIMTARSSMPPEGGTQPDRLYSPEAEMAMELVGLPDCPLIGYGTLVALGERIGQPVQALLKPAPFHAMAAIFAAHEKTTMHELEALFNSMKDGRKWFPYYKPLRLHIFEDAPVGIRAVRAAGELLRQAGMDIEVCAYGIATNADKQAALSNTRADVFPDINTILTLLLKEGSQ